MKLRATVENGHDLGKTPSAGSLRRALPNHRQTNMKEANSNEPTAEVEEEVRKLQDELTDDRARIQHPFQNQPRPSNADNTAIDREGNIHSGDALPDPIGDTLQDETPTESLDYYQDDILDEDPILGGPQGIRNQPSDTTMLENIADMDENVLDRIEEESEPETNDR